MIANDSSLIDNRRPKIFTQLYRLSNYILSTILLSYYKIDILYQYKNW